MRARRSIAFPVLCALAGLALLLSGCGSEPAPSADAGGTSEDLVASASEPATEEPGSVTEAGLQDVEIAYIFSRGREIGTEGDEYVEIANFGDVTVDIACWTLRKLGEPETTYRFDSSPCSGGSKTLLDPGETVWVFTNRCSEISGHHSFGSEEAIWDNDGGTARLLDCDGNLVDEYTY